MISMVTTISHAQTTTQFMGWMAVFGSSTLNSQFSLHWESQLRSEDDLKEMMTFILRAGLIYKLKNNQTLTAGLAYIDHHRTMDSVSGWGPEYRIWEQYVLNKSFSLSSHFITIQNRFRLEQRFNSKSMVSENELVNDGYNFTQRLRYFARSIYPLAATPKNAFQQGTYLSLQDEIFFNLSNTSATNGKLFDQNRFYFSVGYRFNQKMDGELGYMNQLIARSGDQKTINHILQLAFYFRL